MLVRICIKSENRHESEIAMAIKEEQFSYYSQLTKRIDSGMDYQSGSKSGDDLSPMVKGILVAAIVIGGSAIMYMMQ